MEKIKINYKGDILKGRYTAQNVKKLSQLPISPNSS
jgi:hypothetical protein